jgi:hypothetical protein
MAVNISDHFQGHRHQSLFPHKYVFLTIETPTHASICQDPSSKHLKRDDILNIICQASEWNLTTSGNAAYMWLELALARVASEKTQLEGLK